MSVSRTWPNPRCANHQHCAYRDDDPERCPQCHSTHAICGGTHALRGAPDKPAESTQDDLAAVEANLAKLPARKPFKKSELIELLRGDTRATDKQINAVIAEARAVRLIIMTGSRATARYTKVLS